LALVLGAIALGCFAYWWLNRGFATTDDAEIDGSIYTISPQIAGRVVRVAVDDNQHVGAGQVLAALDDRDALVALGRAQADFAQAVAQAAEARAQAQSAAAQLQENNANLQQAQQDFDRFRHVNPHAVTQQQVDAATATIAAARAKCAGSSGTCPGGVNNDIRTAAPPPNSKNNPTKTHLAESQSNPRASRLIGGLPLVLGDGVLASKARGASPPWTPH